MNLREKILGADDLQTEMVDCLTWGVKIYVTTMSAADRDSFEQSMLKKVKGKQVTSLDNVRARLAVRVCCDEEGNRIFNDSDADELGKKSASEMDKIFSVAQRLNGLSDQDIEELEGNS
jgi:hypothetical protein